MVNSTIGSLCKRFNSGKGLSSDKIVNKGMYPVIGANGIRGYTDSYNFEGRCAVIGRQGAYCGNVHYFEGKAYMTEHAIVAEANKENDSGYLALLFKRMNLSQFQGQSAQPGLSVETLSHVSVTVPPLKIQKQIFSGIHCITQKIDNNKCLIKELINLSKLIYDYWFVQFDFPDENGRPYKSNGGKMIWSETLNRWIPEGWRVKQIGQLMTMHTESVIPKNNPGIRWEHYSIPAFDENHFPAYETGAQIASNKYKVPNDSILISKLNPQFKRLWRPLHLTKNEICSTEFVVLVPNCKKELGYCYSLLDSERFQKYLAQNVSSSTGSRSRIQPNVLIKYQEAIPSQELRERFSQIVELLFQMEDRIYKENAELAYLKDFLIPLLMNGQVTFKEKEA